MNHIYRSIWNATLGCWVAAPENARAGSKASLISRCATTATGGKSRSALAVLTLVMACALAWPVLGHSQGQFWDGNWIVSNGSVDGGSGTWTAVDSNWTTVDGFVNETWVSDFAVFQGTAGTVTVQGPQSFTGMQFVTDGYNLQAGAAGALTAVNGSGGNTAIHVDPNVTATLGVGINGSGTLAKLDSGTLVLNGASTYSGGTLLNGGRLVVGNNSALGSGALTAAAGTTLDSNSAVSLANAVNLSGNLTIGGSQSLTLNGAIDGAGGLIKNGASNLTLSGNNDFSGGLTLNAGTLTVGSSTAIGRSNLIVNGAASLDSNSAQNLSNKVVLNADLTYAGSNDLILSGDIIGTGALIKNGAAKLTLGAINTYQGGTKVNAGTLVVAQESALGQGNVTVGNGAALEVLHQAIVEGDLTFNQGAIYRVYADPAGGAKDVDGTPLNNSWIGVTGTATLDGSVLHVGPQPDAQTGFQVGKTYTILTAANGVVGSFAEASSSYAFLDASLSVVDSAFNYLPIGAKDVLLELKRKSSGGNNGGQMQFADLANTSNQGGAARAIESLPTTGALYQYVQTLPVGTPASVFSSLSGDAHSTVMGSVNMLGAHAPNISQQHLRSNMTAGFRAGAPTAQASGTMPASALPSSKALPAWVEVVGHWQKMDGNSNAPGVKQNTTGLFLGADEEVGNSGWRVGGSVGYTSADAKVSSRDASADINSYSAAVYTGKGFSHGANRINVMGGLAYTKHSIESERSVATLNQNLKADYSAHTAQLFAEVGYAMGQYDKQGFEPFVGITLGEQRTSSFKESGGFAALSSQSSRDTLASTTLGVRAHSDFKLAGKDTRVRGTLGVRHAWGKLSQNRTMAFEGSSSFTVAGAPLARNTALVGLQAEMALSRYSALVLGYNGEYGNGSRDQSASVKVRWAF